MGQAFWNGFLFSLGYFVVGLYWIGNALLVEGNESFLWVWPLAVIALPTALSLFAAIYLSINQKLFSRSSLSKFLGFCVFLSLAEWLRSIAFTGFPWNLYGYAWLKQLEIAQIASIIGPYGITLLSILWASSLGYFLASIKERKVISSMIVMLFIIASIGMSYMYGTLRLNNAEPNNYYSDVSVKIIQPNIAQADKWKPELLVKNLETHIKQSNWQPSPQNKTIIVWPETAVPPAFVNNYAVNERINLTLNNNNAILLSGALNIEYQKNRYSPKYYNALNYWDGQSPSKRIYTKSHLVPFGEYIPFQKYIPLQTVTSFSSFESGSGPQTIQLPNMPAFSPLICYETIFPHEAVNENQRPEWILIVTNDAWYGDSAGPYQHFAQAQWRAIEQGLPVIRSANNGISGIINPYGHTTSQTELMKRDNIVGNLPKPIAGGTYYSVYKNIPYSAICCLLLLLALVLKRQKSL